MRFIHKGKVVTVASGSPPPPPPPPPPPGAVFLGTDTTTQTNWKGVYGATGYLLAENNLTGVQSLPAGISVINNAPQWHDFGVSPPASWVVDRGDTSGVFGSVWFESGNTTWTIEVDQVSPAQYHLEVQIGDPDAAGRTTQLKITDIHGVVYDGPRQFTGLQNGVYVKYAVVGSIIVSFISAAGDPGNAVSAGLLFDA